MHAAALTLASMTPQCATTAGGIIGGVLIGAFILAIVVCAIGWSRAANRAGRARFGKASADKTRISKRYVAK